MLADHRILAVRLGSMGDIIHTLPAVATLKHSFPGSHLAWIVDPKWSILLEGNPFIDEVILLDRRRLRSILEVRRHLRAGRFDTAIDFQGLIKSAIAASVAWPDRIIGFHQSQVRERLAAFFYSRRVLARASHIVDRNVELAAAAGAANPLYVFPLPGGTPEGELPRGEFVLAAPLAGWPGKQWPLEHYAELARLLEGGLRMPLVLNGAPDAASVLERVTGCRTHYSTVGGLIDATRRAAAVVGTDSGPLHLAAALDKPGVAVFGPTDPARNGPYGKSFMVLRVPDALTSYKRRMEIDPSMRAVTPRQVFEALEQRLAARARPAEGGL